MIRVQLWHVVDGRRTPLCTLYTLSTKRRFSLFSLRMRC